MIAPSWPIVFVSSLERSGSTLLDLMLGAHRSYVGLGEAYRVAQWSPDRVEREQNRSCSCGETLSTCKFWHPVVDELRENHHRSDVEKYEIIIRQFRSHFGHGITPVDSSKSIRSLHALLATESANVKIIYVVRDVRSWSVSIREAVRRNKRDEIRWRGLLSIDQWPEWRAYGRHLILRKLPGGLFWDWYLRNRRIERALEKSGADVLRIGYEELALYPQVIVPIICEFLGVPFDEAMLNLSESDSHVLSGNRMASQSEKTVAISYDDRWFRKGGWQWSAVLNPHIMRHSRRTVYGNLNSTIWEA